LCRNAVCQSLACAGSFYQQVSKHDSSLRRCWGVAHVRLEQALAASCSHNSPPPSPADGQLCKTHVPVLLAAGRRVCHPFPQPPILKTTRSCAAVAAAQSHLLLHDHDEQLTVGCAYTHCTIVQALAGSTALQESRRIPSPLPPPLCYCCACSMTGPSRDYPPVMHGRLHSHPPTHLFMCPVGQAERTNSKPPPPILLTWGAVSKVKPKSIDSQMLPAIAHWQPDVRPDCASQSVLRPLLRA
jgi:hypothetical protein